MCKYVYIWTSSKTTLNFAHLTAKARLLFADAGCFSLRRLYAYIVDRQSPLGPVDPSFRALSGRLKFTVRHHKFNKDSLSDYLFLSVFWADNRLLCADVSTVSPLSFSRSLPFSLSLSLALSFSLPLSRTL